MYPNTIPHSGRLFLYIYRKRMKKKFLVRPRPFLQNFTICVFLTRSGVRKVSKRLHRTKSEDSARNFSHPQPAANRYGDFLRKERVEAAPKGIGTASGNKEVEVYIIRRCLQFMMPFPAGFPGSAASCLRRTFPGIFRGSLLGRRVLLYPVHSIFQRRSYISWCIVQVCTCPFTLIERLR